MCGIAGLCSLKTPLTDQHENVLMNMLHAIRHRGPDESGMFQSDHVGMVNARLSIIDPSTGSQPISNEDESLWIVYNGEIFNFRELRQDLETKGHHFRTRSDTEVILHLYEQYGPDSLSLLNGQFAFVIYDLNKQKLFVARDRFGIKPFYYHFSEGYFIFGSEVKSLLAAPQVTPALDYESLNNIFTCWTTIPPKTIFKDILELPPAHYLTLTATGDLQIKRYWQLLPARSAALPVEEYTSELEELLTDAVHRRTYADVPVAAYLSGGLDSSITTALIKRRNPLLRTYSITFADKEFDESAYQKIALQFLGTEHHALKINNSDISDYFRDVIAHAECPLLRTAPIPLYLLSKRVHEQGFKVVITGEGADEIFGGYNIFKEALVREFWSKNPSSKYRPLLLQKLYPFLEIMSGSQARNMAMFFGYRLNDVDHPFYSHLLRWKNTSRLRQFLNPEVKCFYNAESAEQQIANLLPPDFKDYPLLPRAQLLEICLFMSNYLLSSQGDRICMAHAVEGRHPFLDHRVAEFAMGLPEKWRVLGLNEKYILKRLGSRLLPKEIVTRSKHPYRAPITPLIQSDRSGALRGYLSPDGIRKQNLFSEVAVQNLLQRIDSEAAISETENMALIGILSTQCLMDLAQESWNSPQDTPCRNKIKRVLRRSKQPEA